MPIYEVFYKQTDYYTATIEAESEGEAREKFADFDFDDSSFCEGENTELITIDVQEGT
jgi:hypothetical protein